MKAAAVVLLTLMLSGCATTVLVVKSSCQGTDSPDILKCDEFQP